MEVKIMFVLVGVFTSFAMAQDNVTASPRGMGGSNIISPWNRMADDYGKCMQSSDFINCVAMKSVTYIQRASRLYKIHLLPGVNLVRTKPYSEIVKKSFTSHDIDNKIDIDGENSDDMVYMLLESITDFLSSHSIEIKLPEAPQAARAFLDEGRGKKNKKGSKIINKIMNAIGMKLAMLTPLMLLIVKKLALKALIIGKIALLLSLGSSMIGSKVAALFKSDDCHVSSGGGGWDTGSSSSGHGGYAKRVDYGSLAYANQPGVYGQ